MGWREEEAAKAKARADEKNARLPAQLLPHHTEGPWTEFWDMHSGGRLKEDPFHYIYIQAPESEARVIFYNRYGHNPARVTCTCCGADYSLRESNTLYEATGYHRKCYTLVGKGSVDLKKLYWEEDEPVPEGLRRDMKWRTPEQKPKPLAEFIKQDDVLVIFKEDITDEERKGDADDLPVQGYVWQ